MRPLYIVTEEAWSISSNANGRRLLGSSEQPLFSGGAKSVAYAYAKQRASGFVFHGFNQDGEHPYWWGRNEGDRVNRRFVIKPAASRASAALGHGDASRGTASVALVL